MRLLIYPIVAILLTGTSHAAGNPVEVGDVNWGRDHDKAFRMSADTGKPVLILFQEVPGCAGCKKYGKEVLKNPLIVEAIEDEFVPLLVFNNQGGTDRELLKQYREKAWSYQAMRFLDAGKKDLIKPIGSIFGTGQTVSRISEALKAADRKVPEYLKSVILEYPAKGLSYIDFAMFCYWTGELKLGSLESVVKTEAGWLDGREVTRVWFDPARTSLTSLVAEASKLKCADTVYIPGKSMHAVQRIKELRFKVKNADDVRKPYAAAKASDQKKQIEGSSFMKLGLSDYQLTKVNAFARTNPARATQQLSPRQLKALAAETR